jgi:uncharacterized iron-regulated membrane protein
MQQQSSNAATGGYFAIVALVTHRIGEWLAASEAILSGLASIATIVAAGFSIYMLIRKRKNKGPGNAPDEDLES